MPLEKPRKIHVGFKLDEEVYKALQRLAEEEHQTVSGMLRKIIAAVLESLEA